MNNYFLLDEEKEYIIYGAGGNGFNVSQMLEKHGYSVKGFIDKRAESMGSVQGKSVWNLETLDELRIEADRIVIIIAIKNVFAHSDIVDELARRGFRQCIYKPLPILKGYSDEVLEKIGDAYDALFTEGHMILQQLKLPKVQYNYRMYYKDRLLIRQDGEKVLAWIPLELLFNYKESDAYEKFSMAVFYPLNDLYELFSGKTERTVEFVLDNFYCYASEWAKKWQVAVDEDRKKSWIESRKAAFDQMYENFDYDFDFFYRSAPQARMNDLGKFYLTCSGRNRVVFLSVKGYVHVPIRLDWEDYEKWLHEDVFVEIRKYIEKNRITRFYAPIAHPYLKDITVENVEYFQLVCFPVAGFLFRLLYHKAKKNEQGYCVVDKDIVRSLINGCSILCDIDDGGAISRYLDRCGFHVYRSSNEDVLIKWLDKLFYQNIEEAVWQKENQYMVFITNKNVKSIAKKSYTKAEIIIRIESVEDVDSFEEYTFVKELSNMFQVDGMKTVRVYKKSYEKT